MHIVIRKVTVDDMQDVYNLVHELAVFEKEPEALIISVNEYIEAYTESLFDGFVATHNDNVVGIAIFYMTFSTWKGKCLYLENFYVQPGFRKFGIGQKLFDAYIIEAKNLGANMTKWQVLDWNNIGLEFYKKNNATIEKVEVEWKNVFKLKITLNK